MFNTPAFALLTLYAAIILASYAVVRRGWLRAYPVFVVGGTINALVMFLFSLARGNMVMQAALVGPSVGFLFAAGGVLLARYFRATAPAQIAMYPIVALPDAGSLPLEHKQAA